MQISNCMSVSKPSSFDLHTISYQDPQSLPGFLGSLILLQPSREPRPQRGPLRLPLSALPGGFHHSGTTPAQQDREGPVETGTVFKVTLTQTGLAQLPTSSLDSTTAFRLHKILLKAQGIAPSTPTSVAMLPVTHSSH